MSCGRLLKLPVAPANGSLLCALEGGASTPGPTHTNPSSPHLGARPHLPAPWRSRVLRSTKSDPQRPA